jgi:HK97 family phage prohead protease
MAKYNADQLKAMGAKGHAFKNPDGSFSYPIGDAEDLANAIRAVGRGGASHDALRRYIIARAKAMGMSSKIPDTWNSDGSLRAAPTLDVERRFTLVSVETRSASDGRPVRIGGYAAKFNVFSRNLGGFVEQVTPSFFNQSRGDGWPDVLARFNHEDSMLLGTTAGRTLELHIDNIGLDYEVEPPPSMQHVVELVQRGDVQKSSFAFRTLEDDWTTTEDGGPLRSLVSGVLIDVAPVVAPAYTDTSAGLRSLAHRFDADLEEVRSLAEVGELRKFFVRTDTSGGAPPKPKIFAAAKAAELLARREDPYA